MTAKRFAATAILATLTIWPARAEDAGTRIERPFKLVSLWSDEMMAYLTGARQSPCSGPETDPTTCRRLAPGVCDGTAYFKFLSAKTLSMRGPARGLPAKQTESATPQSFELELWGAGYSFVSNLYDFDAREFNQIQMVFNCSFSGNDVGCPSGRFQTGRVRLVELGRLDGTKIVDATKDAHVLPDGPIVIPVGQGLKDTLFADPNTIYYAQAVAECFSVRPTPYEWTLPVYEEPSTSALRAGGLVVRVDAGEMDLRYRPVSGDEVPFTADWVQPDWGYSFEMALTMLDREENWYKLPPRPFPRAVWIQLPPRALDSPEVTLEEHRIYTLSKRVRARRPGGRGAVVFPAGTNIFIAAIRDRALEIRKEEPFDVPCTEEELAFPRRRVPTYPVEAAEFYDGDLHLQLQVAYPKGC